MTEKFDAFPDLMWAGTDHSLVIARSVYASILAGPFSQPQPEEEGEDEPYNVSLQGNVAVVRIVGPLLNSDSKYARYFGATTYADIRRAMVYAAEHAGVEAILLDIDSGGGAVSGVADTGELIANVHANFKPVYAYTDGAMASAAYWLGSSAGKVYTGKTSIMGSIGVITTHTEYSEAMKKAGVGVTVLRAGEYKALANSAEPLTEVAEAQIQAQLEAAYGVFISHVAACRGVSLTSADSTMGKGREFFGEAAVTAGLADGITNFDRLMSTINAAVVDTIAKRTNNAHNFQRGSIMPKQALTEQRIAALATGALSAAIEGEVANAAAEAVVEVVLESAAPVTTSAEAPGDAAVSGVVSYLQAQLTSTMQEAATAKSALASANTRIEGLLIAQKGLAEIAAKSVSHMKVAMGMPRADLSALSPESLLAEHASTSEAFTSTFKVGGVAAVSSSESNQASAEIDPQFAARVAANRSTIRK